MTALDVKQAKQALSWRLAQWGVTADVEGKAASFIDDLVSKGWQMSPDREARRHPARAGIDECRTHPGEHGGSCRACAADRLAADKEATTPTRPLKSVPPPPTYLDARRQLGAPSSAEADCRRRETEPTPEGEQ